MRITSKGQVTIPIELREKAGLLPHTEVEFELDGNGVRIVQKTDSGKQGRGAQVLRRLQGRATVSLTTDEIMAHSRGA